MFSLHTALLRTLGFTLLILAIPAQSSNFVYPDASLWHEVEVKQEGDYAIRMVYPTGKSTIERQRITAMLTGVGGNAARGESRSEIPAGGIPAYFTVIVNRLPSMKPAYDTIVPNPPSTPVSAGRQVNLLKVHLLPGRYEVWVMTGRSSAEMKAAQLKSRLLVAELKNGQDGAILPLQGRSTPCSSEIDEFRKNVCHEYPNR